MDIHEYQSKEILAGYGVNIPRGSLAYSPEQASYRAQEMGGNGWVVKAQIHSGGRGEAGGVVMCKTAHEVEDAANGMLGKTLVTKQTGKQGKIVSRLYFEELTDIAQEIYLGFVLDRKTERVMVIASAEGGMEIEDLSENKPDSLVRMAIDPATGMLDFQAREIAFALKLDKNLINKAVSIIMACYLAMKELDATMVEINPLVVTGGSDMIALDAKMSFDDNATFRHPRIAELRDKGQEDPRESYANDRGLSYVGLDGNIGCMINGAGLAMATLDMIKLSGGEPANFLDIGGGASPERVIKAFRAVLRDPEVKVVLVNIFAGINRCDWVAEGVVRAMRELEIKLPVVVRLAGTNVEEGQRIINESTIPLIVADDLEDAAQKAVAALAA